MTSADPYYLDIACHAMLWCDVNVMNVMNVEMKATLHNVLEDNMHQL